MMPALLQLLRCLEEILDPARQNRIAELFTDTLNWRPVKRLPLVLTYPHSKDSPAGVAGATFKPYPPGQALDNPEEMLCNELVHAFDSSIARRDLLDDDLPCTIRANFGTVIIASMFGARVERKRDNPPWVRPIGAGAFERVLDCDPLDFSKGLCPDPSYAVGR